MKLNITSKSYKIKPKEVWTVNKDLVKATVDLEIEDICKLILRGHAFTPAELNSPVHYLNKEGQIVNLIVTQEMWNGGSKCTYKDEDDIEQINKNKKTVKIKDAMIVFDINIFKWEIGQGIYRRNNKCWTSQQIFGIDIDNEDFVKDANGKNVKENGKEKKVISKNYITPQEAIDRCIKYGLEPFFSYHTMSSIISGPEKHDKFRLLFKTKEPINDYRMFSLIQILLMEIFPESDKACKDPARLFYGTYAINEDGTLDKTKKIYYKEEALIDIDTLLNSYMTFEKIKDSAHYSHNVKKTFEDIGIRVDNNVPAIFSSQEEALQVYPNAEIVQIMNKYIIFIKDEIQAKYNVSKVRNANGNAKYNAKQINKDKHTFETKNWLKLQKNCALYNDFVNGITFHYNPLFQIIQNLVKVKGGETLVEDVMEAFKDNYLNDYSVAHHNTCYKTYIEGAKGYHAKCKSFCPYYNNGCRCEGYMLDKAQLERGKINIINYNSNYSTINTEMQKITNEVKQILSRSTKTGYDITVIKAPTGFGKTVCYINNVQNGDLIVAPTHKLALQVKNDLEKLNKSVFYFEEKPELVDKKDQDVIDRLKKYGFSGEANKFYYHKADEYQDEITKNFNNPSLVKDIVKKKKVLAYIGKMQIKVVDKITIAAHARLQFLNINDYNNIIIDEDVINTLFTTDSIKTADLELVEKILLAEINAWGNSLIFDRDEYKYANVDRNESKILRLKHFILTTSNKCLSENEIVQSCKHLQGKHYKMQALDILKDKAIKGKKITYNNILTKIQNIRNKFMKTFENDLNTITTKFTTLEIETIYKLLLRNNAKMNTNLVQFFEYLKKNDMNYMYTKSKDEKYGSYHYIIDRSNIIKENKKYIIFSATISKLIYNTLYNDITVLETQKIQSKGKIIQYSKNTSRRQISTQILFNEFDKQEMEWREVNNDILQLKDQIKGRTIITFQKIKDKFTQFGLNVHDKIHFGNCSGYNDLTGENIVIYGTPHMNSVQYLLLAKQLGFDVSDTTIKYRIVKRNEYEFWFATFSTPELQEIQMNLIETELLQAIGRSRALRNDCEVMVFSDFPIPGAEVYVKDKNKYVNKNGDVLIIDKYNKI